MTTSNSTSPSAAPPGGTSPSIGPIMTPSQAPGKYKRSFKNYLIDARFQLKYTGMVVFICAIISAILGGFLYKTSHDVVTEGQRVVEESRKVSDVVKMSIKDDPIYGQNPELAAAFTQASTDSDKQIEEQYRSLVARQQTMLYELIGGFAGLVLVIGALGIWFTHKVAGPIYKMKMLLRQVGDGKLVFHGKLRKGDELQSFFEAFASMVEKLRERQQKEVDQLDAALRIAHGNEAASSESLARVKTVRDEMKRALDV